MAAMSVEQAMAAAIVHHRAGRSAEAEALYRQILRQQPNHAEALHMLGGLASQHGKPELAAQLMRQSIAIDPQQPHYHNNLGLALMSLGQTDTAISAFEEAARLAPANAEIANNLGNAFLEKRQFDSAAAAFQRAISQRPDWAQAYHNLGNALGKLGRTDETLAAFKMAISIDSSLHQSHYNLGVALFQLGRLDAAAESLQSALRLKPELAEAHVFLGNVRKDQGDVDSAIECYRKAIALKPDLEVAHGNLVWVMHFSPGCDARALAKEHARWNQQFAAALAPRVGAASNDRSTSRRLRIGYVSPDFRDHVIGRNILPLLSNHDHERFEVFCYSNVETEDSTTATFRQHADQWRDIAAMDDDQAAALIERDQIDILVDLALHLERHRLLLFARKPAPVQVSFAGYPGSTGLTTIDYRLTDPYLDPPDADPALSSERPHRLPHTFWCYDPYSDEPLSPLPAKSDGRITFGCLNHFCKTNSKTFEMWSPVLRRMPDSRLVLLSHPGSHRQRAIEALGNDASRVQFYDRVSRPEFLKLHHSIDIMLDTYPYNGHSTSLDAWWMGVPVISLSGQTPVSRAGLSQAQNLGMTDLVAETPQEFETIALSLAGDLGRLAELRATLRSRMKASPLMDAAAFAHDIEQAYRQMWRDWATQS